MEDKRKYHIIVGSKAFLIPNCHHLPKMMKLMRFGVGKAIGYRKAESSDI